MKVCQHVNLRLLKPDTYGEDTISSTTLMIFPVGILVLPSTISYVLQVQGFSSFNEVL